MLIIGVAGGSGSGKTTVVKSVIRHFSPDQVVVIPQDAYYYDQSNLSADEKKRINFDHPSSIEFSLLVSHLKALAEGHPVEMPVYDYVTCTRSDKTVTVNPGQVVVVEGILIFTDKKLRELLQLKVFVDADSDERLIRIIRRDLQQRGRDLTAVLNHYSRFVRPMHQIFIEPSKRFADIIIPQGGSNHVAIEMITVRIRQKLNE